MAVLHTARLSLRPFIDDDAPALMHLLGSLEVMRWMTTGWPRPFLLDHALAWIDFVAEDHATSPGHHFAIVARDTNALLGGVGAANDVTSAFNLGFWVGEPHWHQGFAREAVKGVIDHAFATLKASEILAECALSNIRSQRVLLTSGFLSLGNAGLHQPTHDGATTGPAYRLTHADWSADKKADEVHV